MNNINYENLRAARAEMINNWTKHEHHPRIRWINKFHSKLFLERWSSSILWDFFFFEHSEVIEFLRLRPMYYTRENHKASLRLTSSPTNTHIHTRFHLMKTVQIIRRLRACFTREISVHPPRRSRRVRRHGVKKRMKRIKPMLNLAGYALVWSTTTRRGLFI